MEAILDFAPSPSTRTVQSSQHYSALIYRILIAHQHPLIRCGLRAALSESRSSLDLTEASVLEDVLVLMRCFRPHLILLDIQFRLEATWLDCQYFKETLARSFLLAFSLHDHDADLWRAWKLGALGLVLQEGSLPDLLDAVERAARGETLWTATQLQRIWTWRKEVEQRLMSLTDRERQVLRLLGKSCTNTDICDQLGITSKTVESHIRQLFTKLDCSCRLQVISWVHERGVLEVLGDVPLMTDGKDKGFRAAPDDLRRKLIYSGNG